MNQYDVIVPITKRDREQFDQLGNQKPSYVCPAGLDPDITDATVIPPFRSSLFFIGSLEWKPNQDGLIWFVQQVMPVMRNQFPDLQLHIAGRNAPSWLAAHLNLPGVEFYGEIADARVFMQNHGILVAPCFSGGGMRVKIIEAMSIGLPVVTTPIGAEGLEAIHEEQLLIADSIESFVKEIDRLIKNPEFYMKIGNNAHTFIQLHFNSLHMARDLVAFYNTNRQ
jgi:polysaccharide biosynthesis protein PslH